MQFTRDIIREVMGFAPYEKRAMEVLKVGNEKRAQRFCKKRLGTHQRGVMVRIQPARPVPRAAPWQPSKSAGCRRLPSRALFFYGSSSHAWWLLLFVRAQKKNQLSEAIRTMRR